MLRIWRFILWAAFVLCGLFLLTLALPVPSWRTGRTPAPPLELQVNSETAGVPGRIWIDTDAACGATARTDPDDCLAIVLLVKARDQNIIGISTVFGNASLDVVEATTRRLAGLLAGEQASAPVVHMGAATADGIGEPTPARAALEKALANGPLTIVSLGPLTNVAATLQGRPDLQRNVTGIIAVMGHRPGHIFHPTEGRNRANLLGHGPIFRDFNFANDPEAARRVISMQLATILIPYDAARHIGITARDLDALASGGPVAAWIAAQAHGWLEYWTDKIGRKEFYPFDLAAAAYVLHPSMFSCARAHAWVGRDNAVWTSWFYRPEALLIGREDTYPEEDGASVLYCPKASPGLKESLISRLTAMPRSMDQ